jgi:hypothetical protein
MIASGLVSAPGLKLSVVGDALRCQECSREWDAVETTSWCALLTEENPPRVVLYCERCAASEFSLRRY